MRIAPTRAGVERVTTYRQEMKSITHFFALISWKVSGPRPIKSMVCSGT